MRLLAVGNGKSVHVIGRVEAMGRRGHAVRLLTEIPGEKANQLTPPPRAKAPQILRYLWRMLRTQPADAVHVHYAAGYGAWLAGACGRAPLVVSVMGGDILADEQMGQNVLERWLTRSLLRRADLVTSKSAELTNHLTRIGVAPQRILPLVWGVDETLFRRRDATALRTRMGLAPTARVVLSPRALRPFYNIHVIVDAFAAMATASPDAVLVITEYQADADYREMLRRRIESAGLADRVHFVGKVEIDEMADYYSLAEMVVSIPASDGIPQSLLEALACGVPVILSDLQCYHEWVADGVSALMIAIETADLAAAMARLLEDGRLRTGLAAAGLEVIAKGGGLEANLDRLDAALSRLPRGMGRSPSLAVLVGVMILMMARALAARLPFLRQ
ncbi:hypothetical protein CU669_11170 [Paramagnetospirillum kuznetsovii]|uniref:Glycosyltransferase n=1 Tax=Paramagnetospirillum kuznetsovii TaxID=2053833 RepID=A0A364NXQ0_9PROT|nr:glycosyltransferase [Paramagnetospirillum kuznetsovii]RAU21858.1 hypothetical protein CU669_11170 [Paramagnetospirillum kuznetsovii]